MAPIGTIKNKIASAGLKSAEQLRAAAVRAAGRNGRMPYVYEEPQEDVLLMQETVSERMREGEAPESVLGSSFYLHSDAEAAAAADQVCPRRIMLWRSGPTEIHLITTPVASSIRLI